jgi:hypothetical protein
MTEITYPQIQMMASDIARSGLFAGITTPQQAAALMLLCQSKNLHPAQALSDYHIINNRPTLKADTMLARFQAAGGRVSWTTYTDEKVEGEFSHPSGGSITVDWTMKRAAAAGLGSPTWKKYPRQMLRARVISEAIRTIFPACLDGLYTPEEVIDIPHNQLREEIAQIIEDPAPAPAPAPKKRKAADPLRAGLLSQLREIITEAEAEIPNFSQELRQVYGTTNQIKTENIENVITYARSLLAERREDRDAGVYVYKEEE